jgi:hypothetical protein
LTCDIKGSSFDASYVSFGYHKRYHSFTEDFDAGGTVTLVANPVTESSEFVGWSGACSGTGDCTLAMNSDKSVTATFETLGPECITQNDYIYCRSFKSTEPQGSSCETACSARGLVCENGENGLSLNERMDIFHAAINLGIFTYEEICGPPPSEVESTYVSRGQFTAGRNLYFNSVQDCSYAHEPIDRFSPNGFTYVNICRCRAVLTGRIRGFGNGQVNVDSSDLSYTSDFTLAYDDSPTVTLTAMAAAYSKFDGWEGCDSVSGPYNNVCTVSMDRNRSVKAKFIEEEIGTECTVYQNYTYCRGFKLTDPQGSSCNAACSARGYTCPFGDNKLSTTTQIVELARTFGLLDFEEQYSLRSNSFYYSPWVLERFSDGTKTIYFDPGWNQACIHSPISCSFFETVKICRCEGEPPSCFDSDGGKNYYVKGTAVHDGRSHTDVCSASGYLFEKYCNVSGSVSNATYLCPNGCQDGACIGPANLIKLEDIDNQLASVVNALSGIIEGLRDLITRE